MDEMRIGIIGFGFMGKAHTYGYRTMPLYYENLPFRIKPAGVCTRKLETALKAKEDFDFEFATDNPEDIFLRDDINVINICTPNSCHKSSIIRAIQAGKNIYCEKPLTTSFADAADVLKTLENSSITTQIAFQNRFFPATMRAKEIIQEDKIGKVLSFRACYLHSGSVDPNKPMGWKQDKKTGGGGVLLDLGSHVLDLVYHLIGPFDSLIAKKSIIYGSRPDIEGKIIPVEAEDSVLLIVKMKNGSMGTIEASKASTGMNDEFRVEIHGDKGALRFNLMDPNWLEYYDNSLPDAPLGGLKGFTRIECIQRFNKPGGSFPSSKLSIGWIRAHVHSLYSFLCCVHERKHANPSFRDGAYIQYIMEKAYESDSTDSWVTID